MQAEARSAFLEALGAETRAHVVGVPDLDALLASALRSARAAWPDIEIAAARFFSFLGTRSAGGTPHDLHAADLYLACACAAGDRAALAAFERCHLARLGAALGRRGAGPDTVDEVLQRLRVVLLVRAGERPAGIEGYRGRSHLQAWLHVIGVRELARVEQRVRRDVQHEEERFWVDMVSSDPELSYLKDVYRRAVVLALRTALELLGVDDRALLRSHVVDGLSIDEIGARDRVHRATVARRLERARARLAACVQVEVGRRLRVDAGEISELIGLVRSRLDISIRGILSALPVEGGDRTCA